MINLQTLTNLEEYFKTKSQRNKAGVYFYRIIGYDEQLLIFLRKYQTYAQRKGTYINSTIRNPDPSDIEYLNKQINNQLEMNVQKINIQCQNWLKFLNIGQIETISKATYEILVEMQNTGANASIIKNAYIKFLYWMKYKFQNCIKYIGQDEIPKVLYEGDIGKYELYMLRILSLSGCDVLYINFLNEESYMKYDKQGKYSIRMIKPNRQNPPIHFSKIDIRQIEERQNIMDSLNVVQYKLNTNTWMQKENLNEIFKNNQERNDNQNEIKNVFINYIGIDNKDEYNNRLFNIKNKLEKSSKNYLIIQNQIPIPTLDEISKYRFEYKDKNDIIFEIVKRINITQDEKINQAIKSEIVNIIQTSNEQNPAKIYNMILKQICWIERYSRKLFANFDWINIPTIIYFGNCNKTEAMFLSIMAKLPIDVIYINPSKANKNIFNETSVQNMITTIELENEYNEKMEYPENEVKVRASTVAYKAERELDTILYSDTGLYRNKQFKTSKSITLKTTYEEISILWDQEAKYRPGFEVKENQVIVPNIFAKICGVKDEDTNNYFKTIQDLMTDKTIYIKGFPYIKNFNYYEFYNNANKFIKDNKLNIEEIKKFKTYKYGFLNTNTQDFILSKTQELIDLKIIEQSDLAINQKIVAILLNLDKNLLNLIQQFDFTKEIPKLIITDVDENIATLQDCVIIMFLNLIGFDIIIFTPTGYQNIEKYINISLYEEYQIGNYIYNMQMPRFKISSKKKQKNLWDLFKRRN